MSEINTSHLIAEFQRAAALARGETAAVNKAESGADFSALLKQSIDKVNDMQQTSAELTAAFERGDPRANLVETMVAVQKSGVAFQAMLQVRNKLITAYQEVMSMPV